MNTKLNNGQLHIMRLLSGRGWSKVSKVVWPFVVGLPEELRELKPEEDGGVARLTEKGETVLDYI